MDLFNSLERLAGGLHWPEDFEATIRKKKYHAFTLPKKDGSLRKIESPGGKLKFLQKTVANTLQLLYLKRIPDCVHGYVPAIDPQVGTRHILSNAQAHQQADFLLNLDIDEFFPSIDSIRIMETLRFWLPQIDQAVLELLVHVTTLKNRLPMGAPSSPVLSNMCLFSLDEELLELCRSRQVNYTRYVDDLSFSASQEITADLETALTDLIAKHGFRTNPEKRKRFGAADAKVVTGLILDQGVIRVEAALLQNIRRCIKEYRNLKWLARQMEPKQKWLQHKVKHTEQSINGQLAFLQQVLGTDDPNFQKLNKRFKKATTQRPPSFNFYF